MRTCWMVLFLVGMSLAAEAGEQMKILPPCGKGKTRFVAPTDLVWPEKPGEADVCLWKDDKFAATCVTIDDNCRPDHDWWLKLTDELGFKVTWFVITDNVVAKKNPGFSGTWSDWQRLADAGHSIQSHTTNHKSQKKGQPPLTDEELHAMYRDSLAAINANVTNNFACTIAYPCGEAHEEILAQYAIGARGVYGVPSAAGSINYRCTNKGSGEPAMTDMILEGTSERGPKWVRGKKELKRGLNIILYHFVHAGKTEADREKNAAGAEREMRELASHKDRLWIARFDDVMKYGQERDTATVKSERKGDTLVVSVTDRMDDTLFDYPLTVKVRLPDAWKSVKGGRFITHDGKPYALVDIVPDRQPVTLRR